MSTPDIDLERILDGCFEGEPDGPPVAHHVARGRRFVRRRRATVSLAAAGFVAVVGTGFAVAERGPEAAGLPVTSDTSPATPSPTAQTDYDVPESDQDLARIQGYTVDARGDLLLGEGVEVLDRVDLPAGAGYADRSYGIDLVRKGEEQWVYAPWSQAHDGFTVYPGDQAVAPIAGTTFRDWLDGVVAAQVPPAADPAAELSVRQMTSAFGALDVDSRGRVTPRPDARILERVDNPLGLVAPYESAALRVRYHGAESWWLVSPGRGVPWVPSGDETFEQWVQMRRHEGPTFSASGPMPPIAKIKDGMPVPLPHVEVVRQVDNPLGVAAPARSVAYWARLADGTEWWYLWEIGPSGHFGAEVNRAAGDGYPSFDAWLAAQQSRAAW